MSRFQILLIVVGLSSLGYADNLSEKNQNASSDSSLQRKAEKLLSENIPSIVQKKNVPPSGNLNDYQSLSIYWWPNPINGGKPYIYLDGKTNPAAEKTDSGTLNKFVTQLATLTEAFLSIGDERYANAACSRLKTWFLDPATRMNPHLKYAQAVPGWVDGTPMGILEGLPIALKVPRVVDSLYERGNLTIEEYSAIKEWFEQYVSWLESSPQGRYVDELENNHATWYDVQRVSCYRFLGKQEKAREILKRIGEQRIARQIQADGKQPAELVRTKPFEYSCYNLDAFLTLCEMGVDLDVNVWGYTAPSGASIPKALAYLQDLQARDNQEKALEVRQKASLKRLLARANAIDNQQK